jgi:hypothetical protein
LSYDSLSERRVLFGLKYRMVVLQYLQICLHV